jgi:hypothetical protein
MRNVTARNVHSFVASFKRINPLGLIITYLDPLLIPTICTGCDVIPSGSVGSAFILNIPNRLPLAIVFKTDVGFSPEAVIEYRPLGYK